MSMRNDILRPHGITDCDHNQINLTFIARALNRLTGLAYLRNTVVNTVENEHHDLNSARKATGLLIYGLTVAITITIMFT